MTRDEKMAELNKTIVVTGLMMIDGARRGFLYRFLNRLMEHAQDKDEMKFIIQSAGVLLHKKTILRKEAETIGLPDIARDMQMSEHELLELITISEQADGEMKEMRKAEASTASFSA